MTYDESIDKVVKEDCISAVKKLPENYAHLILSDIPYGISTETWDVLHNNNNSALLGSSPAQRKAGDVFKRRGKPINGWSKEDRKIPFEYYEWCLSWAPDWLRVVKPGGTVFILPGRRFAHRCISAMEDSGFNFRDTLVWEKPGAAHRAQRVSSVFDRRGSEVDSETWKGWKLGNLRPIWEPVLWFSKPYPSTITDNILKHGVGAFNEQAFLKYQSYPNNIISLGYGTGERGMHPHQKPLSLMKALIDLTTKENQLVLDPFCGSGTTLVAAKELGRHFLGYDNDGECVKTCKSRLRNLREINND
jgi:site-specific DNA-methyltransferase (adenine-specific)